MSGGTTRHRRLSGQLVEVRRPSSWDDDDEATSFYQRADAPPRPALPDDPEPDPLPIADDELTTLLPHLVEPRRPGPRAIVPRPQPFVPPAALGARERPIAPLAVQRRDFPPRLVAPRLVELPPAELTPIAPPRAAPPRTVRVPVQRVDSEPRPQPQFSNPPLQMAPDYLAREFGRPRRRPASVSFGLCLLVGGLAFLAARVWHSAPAPGTAVVATTPTDARVFVDGDELVGQTSPFKLADLDVATEHLIEVSKPGFISQTRRVRVEAGDVRVLPSIELEAAQAKPEATTGSIPANLDPASANLRPQRGVTAAGKSTRSRTATAARTRSHSARPRSGSSARPTWRERRAAEATETDDSALAPAAKGPNGTLRINSLPWAEVFIDERSIGTTPQLAVSLAPGRHKLRLVNPELAMVKGFTIDIQPGKTLTKLVRMVE